MVMALQFGIGLEKFGGKHHGYFLPSEGANNIALALFTFESLAGYEIYRQRSFEDADCKAAFKYAADTQCIVIYRDGVEVDLY